MGRGGVVVGLVSDNMSHAEGVANVSRGSSTHGPIG